MASADNLHGLITTLLSGMPVEVEAGPALREQVRRLVDEDYTFTKADTPDLDCSALGTLELSPTFLEVIAGGQTGYATYLMPLLERGGKTTYPPNITNRTKEALRCLSDVAKPLLCPFTGEVVATSTSLGREWFLHRQGARICVIGQLSQPMSYMNTDLLWIFPLERHVVWVAGGFDVLHLKAQISALFARCLVQHDALTSHLNASERKVGLVDFPCPHLAHNLWNVMSGWDGVLRGLAGGATPACILEYEGQNFYGSVAELYPEALEGVLARQCADDDEVLACQLETNVLLATVKGDYLSLDLVDRIVRKAKREIGDDVRRHFDAFFAACDPVMLITIRLDNRAWVQQVEGYAQLVRALRAKCPRLGVVIDGLSSDSIKGWTTGWMSLQDELEAASRIEALLGPSIPVLRSVGRLFQESIAIADAIDFFVAPSGSGMTIYKWLTNKPGVAFSNRAVMTPGSPHRWPLTVWDRFREDITPALYVSPDDVEDAPSKREHISRLNFSMDWSILYEKCLSLLINRKSKERNLL